MVIYILSGILLLFLLYMRFEASWLKVEHHVISENHGLKIVCISDLHPSLCCVTADRVKKELDALSPDLFLFLGDALDKPNDVWKAAAWLKTCAKGIPSYAVLGNHDHALFEKSPDCGNTYAKALRKAGITLAADRQFVYTKNSCKLLLTALDDYQHSTVPFQDVLEDVITPFDYHILFTHNPQRLLELPNAYADFAVAGHFHGGQIWMPFGLEFRLFRKETLGKMGIRRGLHRVNGMPLYLTRGIGNVVVPLRFGARPEVTVLYL